MKLRIAVQHVLVYWSMWSSYAHKSYVRGIAQCWFVLQVSTTDDVHLCFRQPDKGYVLEALTSNVCQDNHTGLPMQFKLRDAFLTYAVSLFLFLKSQEAHRGKTSKMICPTHCMDHDLNALMPHDAAVVLQYIRNCMYRLTLSIFSWPALPRPAPPRPAPPRPAPHQCHETW